MKPLGVGIVGIAPGRGWAALAHIPAIQALAEFELTAVSTRKQESANVAAAHYGAAHAFDNPFQLAAHPDVDVVAICVQAPGHYDVLKAAISARKPIFCEWPLCANTADAESIVHMSNNNNNIPNIMGLQARAMPVFTYAKSLIEDGFVGRVLSASIVSTWRIWGEATYSFNAYTMDDSSGASALHVAGAHTLDALQFCLGPLVNLSAMVQAQREQVRVEDTGEMISTKAIQQFTVQGEMATGALVSVHLQGGALFGSGTRFEVNGTDGDLVISTSGNFGVTNPDIRLEGVRKGGAGFAELLPPAIFTRAPAELAATRAMGTAHLYLDLAQAIRSDACLTPGFEDALNLQRLIDAIVTSGRTGRRVDVARV